MRVVNIAALIAFGGFIFTAFYQFRLGPDWQYLAYVNLGLGLAALLTIALNRFGLEVKVAYFTLWLFIFLAHDVSAGRNGEDHLVLLVGPPLLFYFLGSAYWRWITAVTLVSAVFFIYISLHIPMHISTGETVWDIAAHSIDDIISPQPEDVIFVVLIFGIVAALYFTSYSANAAIEQYEEALERELAISERLLNVLLPTRIIERIKADPDKLVAERFERATILFADLSGFSKYAAENGAGATVTLLDSVFSEFDRLVAHHHLEKIKTIGDSYMVAGGLDAADHDTQSDAVRMAALALEMADSVDQISRNLTPKVSLRVGIHEGPVIAGVIGGDRPFFDVWGDTVNVASRMESAGVPGRVQITTEFYDRIAQFVKCEQRGPIEIKGKGRVTSYWLLGFKEERGARASSGQSAH